MAEAKDKEPLRMFLMEDDPLYGGCVTLEREINLESGEKIFEELIDHVETNTLVSDMLHGSDDVLQTFREIFPELVKSNDATFLTKDSFRTWEEGENDIIIQPDPDPRFEEYQPPNAKDIYIGGPAAAMAAVIQSSGRESGRVQYINYGDKGASNWKGSASYYHIRDAIPVYYWPDNHGAYTLYATVKHFLESHCSPERYLKEVCSNPNWNKLRLSIVDVIREPSVLSLFAKNQYYAMGDVGLHMAWTRLKPAHLTTAHTTTNHAHISKEVVKKLNLPKPAIMESRPEAKAVHVHVGDDATLVETNNVFEHLKEVAGDLVENVKLTEEEIEARGYDSSFVKQVLEFPRDGYIPPYVDGMIEDMIVRRGGSHLTSAKLTKIYVAPTNDDDCRVTRIVLRDDNGRDLTLPVRSLFLSLGPSMRSLQIQDENGIIKENNLLETMMHASGLSSILMIKVDPEKISPEGITKFRDHIDAHNKHIVRLMEKTVTVSGKSFLMFAMQATGGGHFPNAHAHAETGLNVLKANVIPLLKLDSTEGVEYDIISCRSCARGITAQNTFRFAAPAANMSMIYGIGGIGMTTMGANGLFLHALMTKRKELSSGSVTQSEFVEALATSSFGQIQHWPHTNPFTANYLRFLDNAADLKVIAKRLFPVRRNPALKAIRSIARVHKRARFL